MTEIQEKQRQAFIAEGLPYDDASANASDILSPGPNGIPRPVFAGIIKFERKIAEWLQDNDILSPDTPAAAWYVPPQQGEGRGDLPIIVLPQRRDKHEFDVSEHSIRTAWAISQFHRTIYPRLPIDLQENKTIRKLAELTFERLSPLLSDWTLLNSWAMAGFAHDIEKYFELRRPIDESQPAIKNENKTQPKVSIKQRDIGGEYTNTELIHRLFASQRPDIPDKIDGLLYNAQINAETIRQIYNVYKAVDLCIIKHAMCNIRSNEMSSIEIENTYIRIQEITTNPIIQAMGILLMAADNYAQGIPPTAKALETNGEELKEAQKKAELFLEERKRNYRIVTSLLRLIKDENI